METLVAESGARLGQLTTTDAGLRRTLQIARNYAASDLGVLLLGESGTGKELLARAIHDHSGRADGPFIALNCGALSENLMVSELFGHVKGAFTGAQGARDGALVLASGGTLFLDELADASLSVQVALLRVLETQMVRPVGAEKEHPIDVRIIAATSQSFTPLMAKGAFRVDLYYRVAGATLTIPPLRQRPTDIANLARTFAQQAHPGAQLSPAAISHLQSQPWPGNVRELKSAVTRALVHAQSAAARPAKRSAANPPHGSPAILTLAAHHFRDTLDGPDVEAPSSTLPPAASTVRPLQRIGMPETASALPSSAFSASSAFSTSSTFSASSAEQAQLSDELLPALQHLEPQAATYARSGMLLLPPGLSRRKARAYERALLLLIRKAQPLECLLLPEIQQRMHRLLQPGWESAEKGRGLRGLWEWAE